MSSRNMIKHWLRKGDEGIKEGIFHTEEGLTQLRYYNLRLLQAALQECELDVILEGSSTDNPAHRKMWGSLKELRRLLGRHIVKYFTDTGERYKGPYFGEPVEPVAEELQ